MASLGSQPNKENESDTWESQLYEQFNHGLLTLVWEELKEGIEHRTTQELKDGKGGGGGPFEVAKRNMCSGIALGFWRVVQSISTKELSDFFKEASADDAPLKINDAEIGEWLYRIKEDRDDVLPGLACELYKKFALTKPSTNDLDNCDELYRAHRMDRIFGQ